ncbi:type II secretion system protein [Paenibacillus sp. FSL P4-0184]|uniref:type II secretion system protein n=1 Tax=Paenibacillus sp. FSL P4-0184 TaxID=2921632 RepID=UPI0030F5CA76
MLAQAIKRRLSKEENQKGFTLIELLAVIVILGIIAVIAIPMISGIISNTKDDADVATARQIYDAARLYVIAEKKGEFATTPALSIDVTTQLIDNGYLEKGVVLPSNKEAITEAKVNFATDGSLAASNAVVIKTNSLSTDALSKKYSSTQIMKTEK